MKKSSFFHGVSIVTGLLGAFGLIAAWVAGEGGTAFGLSEAHWFNDAIALQLIAISAGVCAIYRNRIEKQS